MRYRIPIVIPVYNHVEHIRRCVSTLPGATWLPHVIYVADDCSTDTDTKHYLDAVAGAGNIQLLRLGNRKSYAQVNNWAVEQLPESEYFCLMNSDIEPTEGWLTAMMMNMEYDQQVGLVGARLIYPDTKEKPWTLSVQHAGVARTPEGYPTHVFRGRKMNDAAVCKRRSINAVTAACMLVRKKAWDQLGGFDERFIGGSFEDVDLCWRAREAGWRIIYEPDAVLFHYEHGSGEEWSEKFSARNCQTLRDKWKGIKGDEYLFEDA